MGVAGSGKTTISQHLAQTLNATFIEADEYHSPANIEKMSKGLPLNDHDRLPWLQSLNTAIKDNESKHQSTIIACSALKQQYRDIITNYLTFPAYFVYLKISPECALQRLSKRTGHYMKPSMATSQFQALEEPTKTQAYTINAEQNLQDIIAQILENFDLT